MTNHPLVGLLVLILATCSGWCTRLHDHESGLGHATTRGEAADHDAEAPRPVNDDNCACAGALPQLESPATAWVLDLTPLPLGHPFALVTPRPGLTPGRERHCDGVTALEAGRTVAADLRAPCLRC